VNSKRYKNSSKKKKQDTQTSPKKKKKIQDMQNFGSKLNLSVYPTASTSRYGVHEALQQQISTLGDQPPKIYPSLNSSMVSTPFIYGCFIHDPNIATILNG
jgi:hypothetical protein